MSNMNKTSEFVCVFFEASLSSNG